MTHTFLRPLVLLSIVGLAAAGSASAEGCSGTITAEETLTAENARYAAQTANDFAAMEKLFGSDLIYNHTTAAVDSKASYIDSFRSGRLKYRKITPKRPQHSHLRLPGGDYWDRRVRDHGARRGSHPAPPLHRDLGEASIRDRARVLAINRHPPKAIARPAEEPSLEPPLPVPGAVELVSQR
jgi:hypothetical protein